MGIFSKKIGIDLGTANTLVFILEKGIVLNEPTVVAISSDKKEVLAVGVEAQEMIGRTPDTIIASKPMKDGVIADYHVTESMIRYFIQKSLGRLQIFKPDVLVTVPGGSTSTERRAVIDATIHGGARAAFIVKEPVLAAIGAGIPINSASGHMIISIGGGTTEVAVISLGGIVTSASKRVGGNKLDQAIIDYLKRRHNLAIGERTAERVKIEIGSAVPIKEEMRVSVLGRDLISGLPKNITISTNEIAEAISERLREITQTIKAVLAETPPELAADIMDKGLILAGGTALLRNLDELITQATGVPTYVADEPLLCVAKGTGIVLENLEFYKRSIMAKR
ncbi:rod shape-determining protein [Candidatus Azambacteria bacterium RIFCSPHIGHO2_01_FULL_44_55]|uniref:Cell shape-determining protein MreB n=1 Tax=Candidatus Azambacteria bacterium RIFCSPLOWO2_02_FULL_44_14 TaxID=1797306 RepID=A0A1F5CBN5_9BACT|nr:MAG: rod shape-determining protein [Candidatus Azambacteria bacterium RIFCSPLOWO2_01_FULL_44_84]OGD33216.1 MAG: rod shape-determining protein [Candidatus Azambacteria bacterium RIFCSPHIGHO2_02_FULL_45_18]OGD40321.1 MAG: rod shape-determining protein [Candidatus Azambacteria bacterium RIFCSPLOWO2_02_FULL_44_14]OGD40684.1 MAG: rod shape-determining protein [Candidatus Azambacteria bacterium RIFCSPHIGHO2_01_FULL_44_55]